MMGIARRGEMGMRGGNIAPVVRGRQSAPFGMGAEQGRRRVLRRIMGGAIVSLGASPMVVEWIARAV